MIDAAGRDAAGRDVEGYVTAGIMAARDKIARLIAATDLEGDAKTQAEGALVDLDLVLDALGVPPCVVGDPWEQELGEAGA